MARTAGSWAQRDRLIRLQPTLELDRLASHRVKSAIDEHQLWETAWESLEGRTAEGGTHGSEPIVANLLAGLVERLGADFQHEAVADALRGMADVVDPEGD